MNSSRNPRRMARPLPASDGAADQPSIGSDIANELEKRPTKQSMVIELLQRDSGASLAELVEATGWLPHTARAALTGLRKKGHAIERTSVDGETRYRIVAAAVSQ